MTISRLDKWIKEEPEPLKYIHIFINGVELTAEFEGRGKKVNYENLLTLLKKIYGVYIMPILYMGVYDDDCIDSNARKEQEAYLNYLTGLGYHIRKCVKYHKSNGEIIEKGAEVSMTVDLEEYGHPTCDKYDTAVVFCNKIGKYRTVLKAIQTTFRKKIKVFSFSQEYETHYQTFMDFIEYVGRIKPTFSPSSQRVHYKKPLDYSHIIGMLNQNTLRNRISTAHISVDKKKLTTWMFIDYGNIHHSLLDLKKKEQLMHSFSEKDLILKLKNRAERNNALTGVIMYMGTPQTTKNIAQLQKLKKKNEQMKASLEKHGIEVRFKFNENQYKGGMKEHGVDLSIGYTIIEKALEDPVEKIILISGDADFVQVVTKLHELGKKVEIWAFTKPEQNCALSHFLIHELSKYGKISSSLKSINSML